MSFDTNIDIPREAAQIINTLHNRNYRAYIVGGCVRDSLLGKTPKDWDITTDASPEEIKKLFDKTVDTGLKHGTVTVVVNKSNYEITTFRSGLSCSKPGIEGDLELRDFTMNAIAYNNEEGFIDPFCGKRDIDNLLIRAVISPCQRYMEDPLRMLRAIRFCAALNFEIEENTLSAIRENCGLILKISPERIREELTNILVSDNPMKFVLLRETGLMRHILPEFDRCFDTTQNHPYHVHNVAIHSLHCVSSIENKSLLRWTMLLHDIGKAVTKTTDNNGIDHFYGHPHKSVYIAENILRRLKFDNKFINKVCLLIDHHDRKIEPGYKSVRRALSIVGKDLFLDLLKVHKADITGQNPEFLTERMHKINMVKEMYYEIKKKNQCIETKDLAISGNDLIELGIEPGKEMGIILKKLLDKVIDNPDLNTKENLIGLLADKNFFNKIVESIFHAKGDLK
ncbi:MAG: CCA tRNA nucleotidyltransferase [Clostridiaceae bacterium]|nr:CCA tRNA nucleotidyltransferase [Clostridiaceae bacterium]